jgi:hypothetical protein
MRRRLYFVLPDLGSAIRTANDLLLARVEDRHMHFLGRRGMSLGELHEASFLQKSDFRHALFVGSVLGAVGGLLVAMFFKVAIGSVGGFEFDVGTVLLATLIGAAFGGWAATLIGISTPNHRLRPFENDLDAGRILLMVDIPASRADEIKALVARRHPEVADRGIEPLMPAFP